VRFGGVFFLYLVYEVDGGDMSTLCYLGDEVGEFNGDGEFA